MTSRTKFQEYLAIEIAGGATWHPNGKQIAFTSNASGQFQIYSTEISKRKTMIRKQLTHEDDRCTNPIYLVDGTLLFTRDRNGDENFQFGLFDEEQNLHWITSDFRVKYRWSFATDTYLYFCANIVDPARFDVYRWRIPLLENEMELLYEPSEGIVEVSGNLNDDSQIVLTQYVGNMNQHILLLDIENKEVTDLTSEVSKDLPARWDVVRCVDSESIVVTTDYESDKKRLGVLKTSKKFLPFKEIEERIDFELEDQYAFSMDSLWTYFVENQEGYSTIHRAKFVGDKILDFETLPFPLRGVLPSGDARSWINAMSLSSDEHMLALTQSSGIQPTNIWIIDIKDMMNWPASQLDTAGIDSSTLVEPTLHRFNSFDSLSVPYFRYIPNGEKPSEGWPTIFMIHGGPEAQMRPDFNPVIQFFLSSGFAVVAPNIRGSDGYGRKYLNLDNVEKRLDSIMDIRCLALHIKNDDTDIDSNRLIIYGGSYGGFAVLSAMTEHPDLWRAGVDIVGISNFVTFLQNTAAWRRTLRECEYGSLEKDIDTLVKISPINRIDKIAAPLFIIQGDNDERVPLSESVQMYEKLKDKGLPVRMMRFADEGHGLAKLSNKIKAYSEVVTWLREVI